MLVKSSMILEYKDGFFLYQSHMNLRNLGLCRSLGLIPSQGTTTNNNKKRNLGLIITSLDAGLQFGGHV